MGLKFWGLDPEYPTFELFRLLWFSRNRKVFTFYFSGVLGE